MTGFSWAGTFAETSHGLTLFGRHPRYGARVLFPLAYGGNDINYSMLGASYCARKSNAAGIHWLRCSLSHGWNDIDWEP